MKRKIPSFLLFAALLSAGTTHLYAQAAMPFSQMKSIDDLRRVITALDAGLFNAYNRCDLPKFAGYIDENIEFYHDKGGVTLGEKALTESVRKNICGRVTRELIPGSLEVYPIQNYGAVEIGVHRFHHPGHDDTEPVGEGKFIHLWHEQNGVWKITRAISYDHKEAAR